MVLRYGENGFSGLPYMQMYTKSVNHREKMYISWQQKLHLSPLKQYWQCFVPFTRFRDWNERDHKVSWIFNFYYRNAFLMISSLFCDLITVLSSNYHRTCKKYDANFLNYSSRYIFPLTVFCTKRIIKILIVRFLFTGVQIALSPPTAYC